MDKVEIGEKDYEAILFKLFEKIKIRRDSWDVYFRIFYSTAEQG
jgi:hypothetical protein